MTLSNAPKLVTVFGGSGFVGRHVVRSLAQRGYNIRVAVRRPDLAGFLQPMGNVGQIVAVQANLRNRASVERAVQGSDHVVNLVGLLFEKGRNKFHAVHELGTGAIAQACRDGGIELTHVSSIGADANSPSEYASSKGRAEDTLRDVLPDATIIRPSIIFGPEDGFFNKFAEMARFSMFLPLIGGGQTKFQPIYVADVAEAIARSVDGTLGAGKVWELGGVEVLTFQQCMELMLKTINRKRSLISIPWFAAKLLGRLMTMVPLIDPPLTRDQVLQLMADNIVSETAHNEGRTLAGMGIEANTLEAILPTYLIRFRPAGQFTKDLVA